MLQVGMYQSSALNPTPLKTWHIFENLAAGAKYQLNIQNAVEIDYAVIFLYFITFKQSNLNT